MSGNTNPCLYCEDGPEPGWLEMDNNGPITCCPLCNPDGERDLVWQLAERQRRMQKEEKK